MRCSTRTQGSHSAQRVGLGILQQLGRSGTDDGDPLAGQVVELAHEGGVTLVEDGVQDREHGRPLLPCRRAGGRGCVGPVNKSGADSDSEFEYSFVPVTERIIERGQYEGVFRSGIEPRFAAELLFDRILSLVTYGTWPDDSDEVTIADMIVEQYRKFFDQVLST